MIHSFVYCSSSIFIFVRNLRRKDMFWIVLGLLLVHMTSKHPSILLSALASNQDYKKQSQEDFTFLRFDLPFHPHSVSYVQTL